MLPRSKPSGDALYKHLCALDEAKLEREQANLRKALGAFFTIMSCLLNGSTTELRQHGAAT